jgi:hypothetical protein
VKKTFIPRAVCGILKLKIPSGENSSGIWFKGMQRGYFRSGDELIKRDVGLFFYEEVRK